jgi:hypothetical protein
MLDESFDKSGSACIILLVYSAGKAPFNFGGDRRANYVYSSIFSHPVNYVSLDIPKYLNATYKYNLVQWWCEGTSQMSLH